MAAALSPEIPLICISCRAKTSLTVWHWKSAQGKLSNYWVSVMAEGIIDSLTSINYDLSKSQFNRITYYLVFQGSIVKLCEGDKRAAGFFSFPASILHVTLSISFQFSGAVVQLPILKKKLYSQDKITLDNKAIWHSSWDWPDKISADIWSWLWGRQLIP